MDYTNNYLWNIYFKGKSVDTFLLSPSLCTSLNGNIEFNDKTFLLNKIAINRQLSLYDETNVFSPFYRQMSYHMYQYEGWKNSLYMKIAYEDVFDAFRFYLNNFNNNKSFILAGFCQGSYLIYFLLRDFYPLIKDRLITCYTIGWPESEQLIKDTNISIAESIDDVGTIVTYDCEDESVESTCIVPLNCKVKSVNPLIWKSDCDYYDNSYHKGACFINDDGSIDKEINNFCGAYIDSKRGVLKITNIDRLDYPSNNYLLPEGSYHRYDVWFFYNNLKDSLHKRILNFLS